MTIQVSSPVELVSRLPRGPERAVVMTMGALHDGHAELIRQARQRVGERGQVVVTIFVNPTQFGVGEDFEKYPRTLDDDLATCAAAGADAVLTPTPEAVYGPAGTFREDSVTIDPGPLGGILEGATRPGHFRGVLTVVSKLMSMTTPDLALFGEKDFQQLTLIRRMVTDLTMPVSVIGIPTVREADGLARSSRNRYLDAHERVVASVVPRALEAVVHAAASGVADPIAVGRKLLAAEPGFELDYLVLTSPDLGPAPAHGEARVLIAGRVGATRLIDNMAVEVCA